MHVCTSRIAPTICASEFKNASEFKIFSGWMGFVAGAGCHHACTRLAVLERCRAATLFPRVSDDPPLCLTVSAAVISMTAGNHRIRSGQVETYCLFVFSFLFV